MKHQLETENEGLRKSIEDTYDEIHKVDIDLTKYSTFEIFDNLLKQQNKYTSNSILVNNETMNDIINWGNQK